MKVIGVALIILAVFAAVMVGFGFGKLGYFHGLLNSPGSHRYRTERSIKFVAATVVVSLITGLYFLW